MKQHDVLLIFGSKLARKDRTCAEDHAGIKSPHDVKLKQLYQLWLSHCYILVTSRAIVFPIFYEARNDIP